jgi:TRAP-type transport system periplasmic protein
MMDTRSIRWDVARRLRRCTRHLWLVALVGLVPTADAVEIRVAHALSDDSHVGRSLAKVAAQLAKESGGRLVLKPLGNGAAGNDQKAMQDVIDGKLEVFISSTSTMVPVYKPLSIWDTPFLFANRAEAHEVLDSKAGQRLLEGASSGGMIGLAYWELGFRNVTNNLHPVTRLEHFQGLRLRTMPSELAIATFSRLGADAKPLPFPQLHDALATGTFDGQENPLPTIVSAKLHEVQKYLTFTKHLYGAYGVMASKKWWDGLSESDQALVRKAFWDARVFQRAQSQRATDEAIATTKTAGVKMSELEPGERWRIARRLETVIAPISKNVGMTLWIDVNNELNRVREAAR